MKNALKMMAVALVLFTFSSNVSAATTGVAGVTKCVSVDQDGNGGVKVKKHCDKDGDKKECCKDKKECCKDKKECCKDKKECNKDKKECNKDKKECNKDSKSCCKKKETSEKTE